MWVAGVTLCGGFKDFLFSIYSVYLLRQVQLPWVFARSWQVHTNSNCIYLKHSLCHMCSFFHTVHLAILPLRVAQFLPCFCVAILPQISSVLLSEAYHYVFSGHYLCKLVVETQVAFHLVYVTCKVRLVCSVAVLKFSL